MNQLPPHDFANLKPHEIALVREAIQEHSAAILSFGGLLAQLVKSAIHDNDHVLHRDLLRMADMIQAADPVFDSLQKREDERQHAHTVATMAPPAKSPLKRGPGMRTRGKIVTSQPPRASLKEIFDHTPSAGSKLSPLARASMFPEDDPNDDIPMDWPTKGRQHMSDDDDDIPF